MSTPVKVVPQLGFVCDFLHPYEGSGKRQLKRIKSDGFYKAFAKSILDEDAPQLAGQNCHLA